jgi:regulator of sirC expression with transglutaminase-like and TPR domain
MCATRTATSWRFRFVPDMPHDHRAESPDQRWARLLAGPAEAVDLTEGALLIAAAHYPDLEIDRYMACLRQMGAEVSSRIGTERDTGAIRCLNAYLFGELGFRPNGDDYYDPRNSYLNDVLDRRVGIPITLSIVYLAVGRAAGLDLEGVSFPGHFLASMPVDGGMLVLDPYAGGVSLGIEDLGERLKSLGVPAFQLEEALTRLLVPAGSREILARMLRNLRQIHHSTRNDLHAAAAAADRIIQLAPAPEEFRERGRIYQALECFRPALADFETYLAGYPAAPDRDAVMLHIGDLRRRVSLLN